jgi:DNA gyrase inhibitor GyrI
MGSLRCGLTGEKKGDSPDAGYKKTKKQLIQELSTWTEILACFEQLSPFGIAWDDREKMYKNICPGT